MSMPDFPLTTPLAESEQDTTEVKTLLASFGDGNEQEAEDGIDPVTYQGGWAFQGTHAEIANAVAFLKLNGITGFMFKPPHLAASRAYKCTQWKDTFETGDDAKIVCRFQKKKVI